MCRESPDHDRVNQWSSHSGEHKTEESIGLVLDLCMRPHRISCHAALLVALARRNAAEGAGTANQPRDGDRAAKRGTTRRVVRVRPCVPPGRVRILRHPDMQQTYRLRN